MLRRGLIFPLLKQRLDFFSYLLHDIRMLNLRQQEIVSFLKTLRDTIVARFSLFEKNTSFTRESWDHHSGGGGEISVIRGEVFEKAAVNWSGVSGPHFPHEDGSGPFFATGVSLITHMMNPHAPTAHMNVRYIETEGGWWFGGGYDLTPMGFPYEEDTQHFHATAKACLDPFGKDIYLQFAQAAKEYFYIRHWKKERGIGGIFFDHYNTGNFERDLALWQAIGTSFLDAVIPIYERRAQQSYTPEEKEMQLKARAHY